MKKAISNIRISAGSVQCPPPPFMRDFFQPSEAQFFLGINEDATLSVAGGHDTKLHRHLTLSHTSSTNNLCNCTYAKTAAE